MAVVLAIDSTISNISFSFKVKVIVLSIHNDAVDNDITGDATFTFPVLELPRQRSAR